MIPFHSLCGDSPEIEKKASSEGLGDGQKTNQDAALAMGKNAAMKELMSLPLAELERRCRHNGLSLAGGREMMVARLLSLEEAEKLRGYELDDDLKIAQSHLSSGRLPTGHREPHVEPESVWNHYGEDEALPQSMGSGSLSTTLPIPEPQLKAFNKKERSDPILPASKWARDDDESDDEQKRGSKGLGLSYSSGSENAGDGFGKAEEADFIDASIPEQPDSGMNEEQRYILFVEWICRVALCVNPSFLLVPHATVLCCYKKM